MSLLGSIATEVLAHAVGASTPQGQSGSVLNSIKTGVRAWLSSHYEAAKRSRDRSWLSGWVQDARLDTSQSDLHELIRISRNFERNDPLSQRFAALWEQYTVGPTGFKIIPASSDLEWNKRAKDYYDSWGEYADVSSRQTIGNLQSLAARRWFFDGRSLIHKTYDPANLRPRVSLLEAHRLTSPPDRLRDEGKTLFNGIEIDPKTGRPIRYWLKSDFDSEQPTPVDPNNIIDISESDRPWDFRPVPVITPALLPLHDLRDLQMLTMRAAKKNASIATIFKTRDGNVPRANLMQRRLTSVGSLSDGTATTEARIQMVRESYGGEIIGIHPDEDIVQPDNNRPGLVEQEYWMFLTSLACIGVNIPRLLVFPHSMQGTVARYDMDAANSFFRSRSAVLQHAFTRLYRWLIEEAARKERKLQPLPPDWYKVTVRPPRSVNADVGRNSQARINELAAGAFTFTDHYAESGDEVEEQLRKKAKEARMILDLAEEFSVDPSMISNVIAKQESAPVEPQTQAIAA
jgi:hypothetical protein